MSDKTKENINVAEEMETSNFIHNIIDRDLKTKPTATGRSTPVFRLSRTVIFISDTPRPSASTSQLHRNTAESATCASTTQIR